METTKAHPVALAKALELAKGDRTRLVIEKGGSVLIANQPVRRRGRTHER